jgi:hypothetical protein
MAIDERRTNQPEDSNVKTTTGGGKDGTSDGSGSGGKGCSTKFPDFTKLTRVQDVLDRNKYVFAWRQFGIFSHVESLSVLGARCGASHGGGRASQIFLEPRRHVISPGLLALCRRILHHIKLNHDSQRPEALAKNFMLLSEVNANIESVQRLYLDIEADYISFMSNNVSKSGGKQTS